MLVPSSVLKRQKKRPRPTENIANNDGLPDAATRKPQNPPGDVAIDDVEPSSKRQKGSNVTVAQVTSEYLQNLVRGLELILSDYAYLEFSRLEWIKQYEKTIDGQRGYFHLAALISHPTLSVLKPTPTQPHLSQALTTHPSALFSLNQLSTRNLLQRINIPTATTLQSSQTLDRRTIYIEPHLSTLASKPAIIARHIASHPSLKPKWLPIQSIWNEAGMRRDGSQWTSQGYAWAIMSGDVEIAWEKGLDKWKALWPEDWIVLPKKEHGKRDEEYRKIREKEKEAKRVLRTDDTRGHVQEHTGQHITQREKEAVHKTQRTPSSGAQNATWQDEKINLDPQNEESPGAEPSRPDPEAEKPGSSPSAVEPERPTVAVPASKSLQADTVPYPAPLEVKPISGQKRRKALAKAKMKKKKKMKAEAEVAGESNTGDDAKEALEDGDQNSGERVEQDLGKGPW